MHQRIAIALVCLAAPFFAACGGKSKTDSANDAQVDEVAAAIEESYDEDDGLSLTDDQILCMAGEVVAGLDDGVLDDLLSGLGEVEPPQEAQMVLLESLFGCVSMVQLLTDSMVAEGATQEEAECFANGFSDDLMKVFLTSEFTGEDPSPEDEEELMTAIFEVAAACGG